MKFRQVPLDYFEESIKQHAPDLIENVNDIYNNLKEPQRATYDSAGYDFFAPYKFRLLPGEDIFIPTGFSIDLNPGTVLIGAPRSGQGSKYFLRLANTLAIIDPGHYGNRQNAGQIFLKLRNEFWGDEHRPNCVLNVNQGQAFAQGLILPFLLVDDDKPAEDNRSNKGGFGSTDFS